MLGSYADPAFKIQFDLALNGAISRLPSGKFTTSGVVGRVARILVKPRDVTGAVLTTAVAVFQMTGPGGRLIQRWVDEHLKIDFTSQINAYLQTFS